MFVHRFVLFLFLCMMNFLACYRSFHTKYLHAHEYTAPVPGEKKYRATVSLKMEICAYSNDDDDNDDVYAREERERVGV